MDAAEADADVKLYKASAELLLEVQAKIPRLVKNPNNGDTFRRWIIDSKIYEVTDRLDAFQEWPQLLDPHLASLVQVLVDAYLFYCVQHPHEYLRSHDLRGQVSPLPRAVARVLYAFCKVRGQKVIVRLLNNEPKYVEPLLSCFRLWSSSANFTDHNKAHAMSWEERYVHLLWLSHLMLAPFELSTISVLSIGEEVKQSFSELFQNMPDVSMNLAIAGLDHLCVSSKAREAASILLVRLSLRADMQKLGMAQRLIDWAIGRLASPADGPRSTGYDNIGLLALMFGIVNSASHAEAAPFLDSVFCMTHTAATSLDKQFTDVRDFAPARKLLVKTMRSTVVHAISISDPNLLLSLQLDVNSMLEDCIQTLLEFLADKDTPVRQAASKALSLICLKLDADMSTEVVEAVVDSLNENMLLEDINSGRLFPATDVLKSSSSEYKKNLDAVNPLKWHGCMLTLGHLLFRRSLPASQLPAVIESLIMGLEFEQRSNVGTSVGVGVRDAACFGIWSLARKYSTNELNRVKLSITSHKHPSSVTDALQCSTLQFIAKSLAVSACLDPSGNLRRGSSAALQELIGRHPDVIAEGIPIVQTIDYHAVARRSRAMVEVAIAASKLSHFYHEASLYALLGWRGARATDVDSRRQAAEASRSLISITSKDGAVRHMREVLVQISLLKLQNTGSNAAARHGLICCLAAIVEQITASGISQHCTEVFELMRPVFRDTRSILGAIDVRITADIENVFEATSRLILACSHLVSSVAEQNTGVIDSEYPTEWATSVIPILEKCTISTDKDFVVGAAARANVAVARILDTNSQRDLLNSWLDQKRQSKAEYTCKGRITTLGQIFELVHSTRDLSQGFEHSIVAYLKVILTSTYPIETKVNAMQSIEYILSVVPGLAKENMEMLVAAIQLGLTDYTADQRGDIGSLLRLESIEATTKLPEGQQQHTMPLIVKLAAEKLVKVRFQAWKCLETSFNIGNLATRTFNHQADVSSFSYFKNLLELLHELQFREPLLTGLVGSLSGGTEEVSSACSEAIIAHIQDQHATMQPILVHSIIESVSSYMCKISNEDDREVVSAIDFLAFLVENVLSSQTDLDQESSVSQLWDASQKVHTASATMIRLEAMIRLYSALALFVSYRAPALEKLTRLLLHRWPKIRAAAADAIFLNTAADSLMLCDWNASAIDNKPVVLSLRKELNVAGSAATNPRTSSTIAG